MNNKEVVTFNCGRLFLCGSLLSVQEILDKKYDTRKLSGKNKESSTKTKKATLH